MKKKLWLLLGCLLWITMAWCGLLPQTAYAWDEGCNCKCNCDWTCIVYYRDSSGSNSHSTYNTRRYEKVSVNAQRDCWVSWFHRKCGNCSATGVQMGKAKKYCEDRYGKKACAPYVNATPPSGYHFTRLERTVSVNCCI